MTINNCEFNFSVGYNSKTTMINKMNRLMHLSLQLAELVLQLENHETWAAAYKRIEDLHAMFHKHTKYQDRLIDWLTTSVSM